MNNCKSCYQYTKEGKFIKGFLSQSLAAAELRVDETSVRKAIKTKGATCKGFCFLDQESHFQLNKEKTRTEYHPQEVAFKNIITSKKEVVHENNCKILFLDIETAPITAYVWKMWNNNISLDQMISDWFMLCWSAKWLGDPNILSDRLNSKEALTQNDKRISKSIWKLLDEADIIVAHNGNKFDLPKICARFIINGLEPPSSYKQIDTCLIAKKEFGFSSNKLDALAKLFGFDCKYETNMSLWINCLNGDENSLRYMEKYCKHDTSILEKVYLKLRPWTKGHPNIGMYEDKPELSCSMCGSSNIKEIPDKYYNTNTVQYQLYRCDDCKGVTRAKAGNKFLYKKKLTVIPR